MDINLDYLDGTKLIILTLKNRRKQKSKMLANILIYKSHGDLVTNKF